MNQRKRRRLALEKRNQAIDRLERLWNSYENATDYGGIDYRGWAAQDQRVNQDKAGFHYGVIPVNRLAHWAWDDLESDYGEPTCSKCGNEAVDIDDETVPILEDLEGTEEEWDTEDGNDFACLGCERTFDSSDAYGDEAIGHDLDDGEYKGHVDRDGIDLMLFQSPYYTLAQFCSPCAPGAGYLPKPSPSGVKTYCLGHDWFEGGKAPYPIWSVKTNRLVKP